MVMERSAILACTKSSPAHGDWRQDRNQADVYLALSYDHRLVDGREA